jgi:hypothetical protein
MRPPASRGVTTCIGPFRLARERPTPPTQKLTLLAGSGGKAGYNPDIDYQPQNTKNP